MIIKNSSTKTKEKPLNIPLGTLICLLFLIGIYLYMQILSGQNKIDFLINFSFIPAIYSDFSTLRFYQIYSPLTYILLHGNFTHLIINLCMLSAFGSIIEKKFGILNLLYIFLFSSIIGVFSHYLIFQNSYSPVIGSSGGICGLFSFYLIEKLIKNKNSNFKIIQTLIILILIFYIFRLIDIFPSINSPEIAWVVHIGGFIGGIFLFYIKKLY